MGLVNVNLDTLVFRVVCLELFKHGAELHAGNAPGGIEEGHNILSRLELHDQLWIAASSVARVWDRDLGGSGSRRTVLTDALNSSMVLTASTLLQLEREYATGGGQDA